MPMRDVLGWLLFLSHAATSLRRSTPTSEGVGSHDAG
jgi:hypothetical protein